MSKIIDMIRVKRQNISDRFYLVLDKHPEWIYDEIKQGFFQAEHDGFFKALQYERAGYHSKAFGGRKFEIKLSDGRTMTCDGSHWDVSPIASEELMGVGINTLDDVTSGHPYIFYSSCIKKSIVEDWLSKNEPKDDYYFYERFVSPKELADFHFDISTPLHLVDPKDVVLNLNSKFKHALMSNDLLIRGHCLKSIRLKLIDAENYRQVYSKESSDKTNIIKNMLRRIMEDRLNGDLSSDAIGELFKELSEEFGLKNTIYPEEIFPGLS